MRSLRSYGLLTGLFFLATVFAGVDESAKPSEVTAASTTNLLSFSAKQVDWVFSGTVVSESDDHFYYFFQLRRDDLEFHAIAALIDAQTNNLVLYEDSKAHFDNPETSQWHVGRAFLRFNAINNSWVFGVTKQGQKGFNFKVDMLGQPEGAVVSRQQSLRAGIELLINRTGRLNGHLQMGDDSQEQFVTAPKAWFRQMWVSKPQDLSHPMTAVLCDFNDGGGFYSVNLQESDAIRGAVAGWRDKQGQSLPMSQFVTVKEDKDALWTILLSSPKMALTLKDLLSDVEGKHDLVAGMVKGTTPGFCTISLHDLGQQLPKQAS